MVFIVFVDIYRHFQLYLD